MNGVLEIENVIEWLTEISLRPCDFATDEFNAYDTEHLANEALEICEDAKVFCQQRNEAFAKLKEQEEQKRKWLQCIADNQLAFAPSERDNAYCYIKHQGIHDGLQMAWEIITG